MSTIIPRFDLQKGKLVPFLSFYFILEWKIIATARIFASRSSAFSLVPLEGNSLDHLFTVLYLSNN